MTESEIEAYVASRLPDWAAGFANGELVPGAQLPTRDGRRIGNAHIIAERPSALGPGRNLYLIITDAGNTFVMSETEIQSAFYTTTYYSAVQEIIKKFWHEPGSPLVDWQ